MCLLDWSHQLNTIIEMIFRTGRVSMEESLFFNYGEPSPPPHHPMDFEAMPWGFIGVSWCDGSFLWHFLFHGPQVGLHTTNPCNSHWGATPGAWSAVAFCWRRKFARMYIPSKSLALKWTGSWGLGWRAFKWVHWTSHCSPLLLHVDGRNPTVKPINTRRGILLFCRVQLHSRIPSTVEKGEQSPWQEKSAMICWACSREANWASLFKNLNKKLS